MSAFRPFSTSRLVLLGIEPYRVHAYWDAEPGAVDEARLRVGDPEARLVLRFHEVSRVELDGASSGETFDIAAGALTGNHYVSLLSPGKTLVAELGLAAAGGPFASLVRSNVVDLPRGSESPEYVERSRRVGGRPDPLWRPRRPETVEDAAPARAADAALSEEEEPGGRGAEAWTEAPLPVLVGAGARAAGEGPAPAPGIREPSLGPGREAAAREAPADAFAGEVLVGEAVVDCDREAPPPREARGPRPVSAAPTAVASATPAACVLPEDPAAPRHEGLGSSSALAASWGRPAEGVSSHERPVQDERPRIEVRADIVIYGRAKPGTEVVIDGIVVPVRPDGTFDLRFALPARRPEEAPEPAGPGGPPGGARP